MYHLRSSVPAILALLILTAFAAPNSGPAKSGFTACEDRQSQQTLSDSQCIRKVVEPAQDEPVELFVRKFPARGDHRGEIWLIAGGPGESGTSFYADIDFFRETFRNYDVMVPDHRGTGYSAKLCRLEETPPSAGGMALASAEWGSCFEQLYANPQRAGRFSLRNAARDLDALVSGLGSGKRTLIYAVSYGTSLALEYARLASSPVGGIILDSLTPAPSDRLSDLSYRSHTTDRVGMALLERCAADSGCRLGPDAVGTYRALLKDLDSGADVPGLEQVPNGDLRQFLGLLLDVPAARNQIPAIIRALSARNPAAGQLIRDTIATVEAYWGKITQYPQATTSIPLSAIISGSEFNGRPGLTAEALAEEKSTLGFTSPLPALLANNRFPLYSPPVPLALPDTMPPLLVLQGTMDPKTPYASAAERAASLGAVTPVAILTLTDAPHAAYLTSQDCLSEPLARFAKNPQAVTSQDCAPAGVAIRFP